MVLVQHESAWSHKYELQLRLRCSRRLFRQSGHSLVGQEVCTEVEACSGFPGGSARKCKALVEFAAVPLVVPAEDVQSGMKKKQVKNFSSINGYVCYSLLFSEI